MLMAKAVDRTRPQQPAPAVTDDGTADKAKKARLKELMEKAITAYAKGDYLESETLAKRAMEVDPNEPAAPMLVFKARTERRFKQDLQNSDAVLSRSVDRSSANWTNRPAGTPRCRIMSAQSGPSSRRQRRRADRRRHESGGPIRECAQAAESRGRRFACWCSQRHQPQRRRVKGEGTQVYMVDLVSGGTTLISDEPVPGRNSSGSPTWSPDGSRILFDATPGNDWDKTHVMSIAVRDGKPTFTDLGPGNCPTISPDGKTIAFLLNPGEMAGSESGVWLMEADGSSRRQAGPYGGPFWSGDGREFLINTFDNFTESTVMNFEKLTGGKLAVPGYRVFSWPSWAGPGTLVASSAPKTKATPSPYSM